MKNYIRFDSDNPNLNFTFLHPSDWERLETRGRHSTYDEMMILGPRNRENTYNLALIVRVTPMVERGGDHKNLDALVADHLSKSSRSTNFRKLLHAKGRLGEVSAVEIESSYTLLLPMNNVNARETPILERRIFFQKEHHFYELVYRSSQEDYAKYLDVLKDAVRTFEFKGDAVPAYQPLITPETHHAALEKPED